MIESGSHSREIISAEVSSSFGNAYTSLSGTSVSVSRHTNFGVGTYPANSLSGFFTAPFAASASTHRMYSGHMDSMYPPLRPHGIPTGKRPGFGDAQSRT